MSFCLLKSIHLSILRIINLVVKLQLNKPYVSHCGEWFTADFLYSSLTPPPLLHSQSLALWTPIKKAGKYAIAFRGSKKITGIQLSPDTRYFFADPAGQMQ